VRVLTKPQGKEEFLAFYSGYRKRRAKDDRQIIILFSESMPQQANI
jgi:hypothetical protein